MNLLLEEYQDLIVHAYNQSTQSPEARCQEVEARKDTANN